MKRASFRFKPFSEKQCHILTWWVPKSKYKDYEGIIADGAIRSGKTVSMSLSFVIWAMETFNQENLLICGKTVGSCRRNVIKPLKRMLVSRGYIVKDRIADNLLTVSKGEKTNDFYIFGGRDESSQDLIQGITAAGLFCDEVALMPKSFVNQATARCSVDGSKWWFNCNPAGPNHWFKKEWIDKAKDRNLVYQHFTLEDNLSLSKRIKDRLRNQYTGVFYERYILGHWALAEGLIYPEYEKAVARADSTVAFTKYVVSIDYGTENPLAAILWAKGTDNVWYARREFYYNGREKGIPKTDDEYVSDMIEFTADVLQGYLDEYNFQVAEERPMPLKEKLLMIVDPSAASFITALQKTKLFKVMKADNDVIDGIRETATAMKQGYIKIDPSMKNWITEANLYVWDEKAEARGEEKPIKANDHAMDSTRYFVKTMHVVQKGRKGR